MGLSILDYNKAREQFRKTGNIAPVNKVIQQFNAMPGNTNYNPGFTPAGQQITSSGSGGGGGGGGGDSQLTALSKIQGRNPVQEAEYRGLLEQTPQAPSFDETPWNELSTQIDQLGNIFQDQTNTAISGIQQRSQSQLAESDLAKQEAEQNLAQYKTQAEQDAQANMDEQRRSYAEIQQGLQSRYGGTTGTGAFVAELAGRQTLQNIGKLQQNLQNEYSKVNQTQANLARSYEIERNKIQSNAEQLYKDAKNSLNKQLADLQIQKGQLAADKSARKTQAIQEYQRLVSEINARNTAYLQQLDQQKMALQNSLQSKAYSMTYQANQKLLGFYESFAKAGVLSDSGLREAESKFGLGGGSLQFPTKKNPNDPSSDNPPTKNNPIDPYSNESLSNF